MFPNTFFGGFVFRWMSKENSLSDTSSKTWVYPYPTIPPPKSEDELWFDSVQSFTKNFAIRDWIVVVWEIVDPNPRRICLGRRSLKHEENYRKLGKIAESVCFFAFFLKIFFKGTNFVASHNKCQSFDFPTHGNMSLRHRKKRSWDKIDLDAENKFVRDSNSATSFENMILSYFVNTYNLESCFQIERANESGKRSNDWRTYRLKIPFWWMFIEPL